MTFEFSYFKRWRGHHSSEKSMTRLLFILKYRENPWGNGDYSGTLSSGLFNSVRFIVEMLTALGIESKMVTVEDNNTIDREVTAYRPTHAIVEAFWVVPEKFTVLKNVHPCVQWIVRNHSEMPFLANEGMALGWIREYLANGVEVMCNSTRAVADTQRIAVAHGLPERLISYGPNHYPVPLPTQLTRPLLSTTLRVGCFGAIRPLKNHVAQAIAALDFARHIGMNLEFHINSTRIEGNADPILKNLRSLFAGAHRAQLIEHAWTDHAQFINVVERMHMLMQVSFSETFNIVSADAVCCGIPVIASEEVPWLGTYALASPTDISGMVARMHHTWAQPAQHRAMQQRQDLINYCRASEEAWMDRFPL